MPLAFDEIAQRLKQLTLPSVDVVYGIGSGGVVPASRMAYQLGRPLELLHINFRAEDNTPQRSAPEILAPAALPERGARILLVDDVSVSGRTMEAAKRFLDGGDVTTLVMKGRADIVVFPEVATCVIWPWKAPTGQT